MLGIFEAPFFCSQTSMESATPRWSRSTLVEQTTPMGHLLFDTSALARNLDFLDIDVDRDLDFFDRRKKPGKIQVEPGDIGLSFTPKPIGSMYGIFAYIYHKNQPNVGKYTIHGSLGKWWVSVSLLLSYFFIGWALRKNSKIQEVMKGSQTISLQ